MSINGVVPDTSLDKEVVLDTECLTKSSNKCNGKYIKNISDCVSNYQGRSRGMELEVY